MTEPASGLDGSDDLLGRLRLGLGQEGLYIVRPVSFACLAESAPAVDLGQSLRGARGACIVGDGGSEFFSRFESSATNAGDDPLDLYTTHVIGRVVGEILSGAAVRWKIVYPFDTGSASLPFHRLGIAAGLPAAGPLGLQIHPRFGAWWAYRGLILLDQPLSTPALLPSSCTGCAAPCINVCPAKAVQLSGFGVSSCAAYRQTSTSCAPSCAARTACVVGRENAYPDRQVAFHSDASLRLLRR